MLFPSTGSGLGLILQEWINSYERVIVGRAVNLAPLWSLASFPCLHTCPLALGQFPFHHVLGAFSMNPLWIKWWTSKMQSSISHVRHFWQTQRVRLRNLYLNVWLWYTQEFENHSLPQEEYKIVDWILCSCPSYSPARFSTWASLPKSYEFQSSGHFSPQPPEVQAEPNQYSNFKLEYFQWVL